MPYALYIALAPELIFTMLLILLIFVSVYFGGPHHLCLEFATYCIRKIMWYEELNLDSKYMLSLLSYFSGFIMPVFLTKTINSHC